MPYKSEKIKIEGGKFDRRIKLTEADKDKIHARAVSESIGSLAREFGVCRRTIQFIVYPERLERKKEALQARGGWRIYYKKEKHSQYIKEHRRYKQELKMEGKI